MTNEEVIITIAIFAIAGVTAFIGIRQFFEKGFLLNNAYIWTSKEEREKINKKPYYRQSAIVFSLISIVFIIIGAALVLKDHRIQLFVIPLIILVLIYAIVSSIKIEKNKKIN